MSFARNAHSIAPAASRMIAVVGLCATLGASNARPASFHMLGDEMTILVTSAQTHGASTTIADTVLPGGGPPAHIHAREDETFVVIRGKFRFWSGTHAVDAGPGAVLYFPRNQPHQFRNVGNTPGEVVFTLFPGGLERMFLTISKRKLTASKDREQLVRLGAEYGITYVAPLAPETNN